MIRATASDIEALRAGLAVAEARAEEAVAKASNAEAIIAALKLMVEKLRREVYGQRSERKARLLDQLELELEELEARRGRSPRRSAGPMRGASSLSWPTSPPRQKGGRRRARRAPSSRRWPLRP